MSRSGGGAPASSTGPPPRVEPRLFSAGILENAPAAEDFLQMELAIPADWGPPRPGQFVSVALPPPDSSGNRGEALLRRPFSVAGFSRADGCARLRLLYAPVGRVTARMRALAPGSQLDCLGPLGSCFPLDAAEPALLVAGGCGVAPLLFLAGELARAGRRFSVLYGTRRAAQMLPAARFAGAAEVLTATDDGSCGRWGTVMDLMETASPLPATVMACGPRPMLAAVARWAAERAIACLVSLETVFGCGTGLCGGCAVPAAGEPRHYLWACREGPVLEAQRLDWKAWSETCAP